MGFAEPALEAGVAFEPMSFVLGISLALALGGLLLGIVALSAAVRAERRNVELCKQLERSSRLDKLHRTNMNFGEVGLFNLKKIEEQHELTGQWIAQSRRFLIHVALGGDPDAPPAQWRTLPKGSGGPD